MSTWVTSSRKLWQRHLTEAPSGVTRRTLPPGSAGPSPHWVIGALPFPHLQPHAPTTIPVKLPNCLPIAASFFALSRRLGALPGSAMIGPSAKQLLSTLPLPGIGGNRISGSPPWRESRSLEQQAAPLPPSPGSDQVVLKPAFGGIGGAATVPHAGTCTSAYNARAMPTRQNVVPNATLQTPGVQMGTVCNRAANGSNSSSDD